MKQASPHQQWCYNLADLKLEPVLYASSFNHSPEDPTIGAGIVKSLIGWHDPVQELGCEREGRHRRQEPLVPQLTRLHSEAMGVVGVLIYESGSLAHLL